MSSTWWQHSLSFIWTQILVITNVDDKRDKLLRGNYWRLFLLFLPHSFQIPVIIIIFVITMRILMIIVIMRIRSVSIICFSCFSVSQILCYNHSPSADWGCFNRVLFQTRRLCYNGLNFWVILSHCFPMGVHLNWMMTPNKKKQLFLLSKVMKIVSRQP